MSKVLNFIFGVLFIAKVLIIAKLIPNYALSWWLVFLPVIVNMFFTFLALMITGLAAAAVKTAKSVVKADKPIRVNYRKW